MATLSSDWPIDPDSAGFLVSDLSRQFRAAFERGVAMAGLGITASEARVIAHLSRGLALRQTDLADRLGVTPMTLIGFLDRLEARGLIVRLADPVDRRVKRISLTKVAAPVVQSIALIIEANRALAAHGIVEADWAAFCRVAAAARDNLAREAGPAA